MKTLITLTLALLLLSPLVVAEEFVPSDADNWFGRIVSKIKSSISGVEAFSVYGLELECSNYPDEIIRFKDGEEVILTGSDFSSGQGFINWFRGSPDNGAYSDHPNIDRQDLGEEWVGNGQTMRWTCVSGQYWYEGFNPFGKGDCYVDLYNCDAPCYSDSDCTGEEFCDTSVLSGSSIPGNPGVCKTEILTHQTQVYECNAGVKVDKGLVSHGSVNFCPNPLETKYLIGTTNHCYSDEPDACVTGVDPDDKWYCDNAPTENLCEPYAFCTWEGSSCSYTPVSSGGIGDACSENFQCASGYCDKNAWYSLGKTCQLIPWSELKKVGLERDEISDLTVNDLLAVACLSNSECIPKNNELTAKCIPISKLKDEGTLTVGVNSFFDNAKLKVNHAIGLGSTIGILSGAACVTGSALVIISAPYTFGGSAVFVPAVASACTTVAIGGAIVGGWRGIGITEKDEIVKLLEAEDSDQVGLCVSEKESKYDLEKYFGWAAFFSITGEKGVDGLIIILVGLGAIALVFKS